MEKFLTKNKVTLLIVLVTLTLAGIAVFTAARLYQTRQGTVAPNAPSSQPAAAGNTSCQTLAFTIATPTPTPTPTHSPSPSPSPTPSPVPQCGSSCTSNANCLTGMSCVSGICRRTTCTTAVNCICATPTPTPSPTPTHSPSPTPSPSPSPIPQCGSSCTTNANCLTGMSCSGGVCRNTNCTSSANCICATPTPSPTPPPTAQCTNIGAYSTSWNQLSASQLAGLQPGTTIYFTVTGTTSGSFDMARFTINGVLQPSVTTTEPGNSAVYYMQYTIPQGVTSFTVSAQLHQAQLNQWF